MATGLIPAKEKKCKKCNGSFQLHEYDEGELDDFCPKCQKIILCFDATLEG